jgi:hypothetical protein
MQISYPILTFPSRSNAPFALFSNARNLYSRLNVRDQIFSPVEKNMFVIFYSLPLRDHKTTDPLN